MRLRHLGQLLVSSETYFTVGLRILQFQCSLPKLSACLRYIYGVSLPYDFFSSQRHTMQIPTPNHKSNALSEASRSVQDSEDTNQLIFDQPLPQRYGLDPEVLLA